MPYDDKNVLGGALAPCSTSPRTGFYRDGCCNTGPEDLGLHVVCVQVTEEFLALRVGAAMTSLPRRRNSVFPVSTLAIDGACAPPPGARRSQPVSQHPSCSR